MEEKEMNVKLGKEDYVLIIGSSNMDLNIYSERLPTPGETITGGTFQQFLGGKGANQAVASARSGANTVFIGKIGNDTFGDQMVRQLSGEGINIDNMIRTSEEHSGVAFIMIDKDGENMISVAPGANATLNPDEIKKHERLIKDAGSLVVQMEIPIETILRIYKIAEKGDVIKILNPAPLKPVPKELFTHIDIIIPNEGELTRLHALLGFRKEKRPSAPLLKWIREMSKDIADLGLRYIITTLGPKGCVLYDKKHDEALLVPAFEVQAVDTVGAGDCFNGVLASQLCKGKSILDAVKLATSAASIAVTRRGAQASLPREPEILEQVKEYEKLYKITSLE